MLKYTETQVTFSEIPDEVALCINISNCPYRCEGCHSSHLQEDIGEELTPKVLTELIQSNKGITCVSLMGGDRSPDEINSLCKIIHNNKLKSCWYSGNTTISPYIDLRNFDYIKIGPYVRSLGGLNSIITNQKMYEIRDNKLTDITHKFQKHEIKN